MCRSCDGLNNAEARITASIGRERAVLAASAFHLSVGCKVGVVAGQRGLESWAGALDSAIEGDRLRRVVGEAGVLEQTTTRVALVYSQAHQ